MYYINTNINDELRERTWCESVDDDRKHGRLPKAYGKTYAMECGFHDMKLRAKLEAKGLY